MRPTPNELISDWHSAVGQSILESWDLPAIIVATTEEHEDLDRDQWIHGTADVVDFVTIANVLANRTPTPPTGIDDPIHRVAPRLGMSGTELWELMQNSAADIRAVVETLR